MILVKYAPNPRHDLVFQLLLIVVGFRASGDLALYSDTNLDQSLLVAVLSGVYKWTDVSIISQNAAHILFGLCCVFSHSWIFFLCKVKARGPWFPLSHVDFIISAA